MAVGPKPGGGTDYQGRSPSQAGSRSLEGPERDASPTGMIICYRCEIRAKRNASTSDRIIPKRLAAIIFHHAVTPTLRMGMGGQGFFYNFLNINSDFFNDQAAQQIS